MTDTEYTTRASRGIALYRDRGAEMIRDGDTFRVPGSGGVTYSVRPEAGYCSCPDHTNRGTFCKHLYAAEIAAAHEACRRRKIARPKRTRHDGLRGVVADPNTLDRVADRLGA